MTPRADFPFYVLSLFSLSNAQLTWFEEDQGLHASELSGVHSQHPKAEDDFLQGAGICADQPQLALGAASS